MGIVIVKWLLITLLPAVALGVVAGIVIGKYRLKQLRGEARPVLTMPQRIISLSSVLVGLALVLVAVFYNPGSDDGVLEGDMMDGGMGMPGGVADLLPETDAAGGPTVDGFDGDIDTPVDDGGEFSVDADETDETEAQAFSAEGNGGTEAQVEVDIAVPVYGGAVRLG